MRQAVLLLLVVATAFAAAHSWLGYDAVYLIGYGALTFMAALISLTFALLWVSRATPLALGMAFSWAGAASVMGWWWLFSLLSQPAPMVKHGALFAFLSLYFVGALLHFTVIQRSLGLGRYAFVVPVGTSLAVSTLLALR